MGAGIAGSKVVATQGRATVTTAATSAVLLVFALAGCGGGPVPAASSSPPTPTNTLTSSPSPLPTVEPLIIPGCDTMLPLSSAKSLFSQNTEVLGDEDSVPLSGDELPEIATAASNASIAKNCVWGVPNSDGAFSLTVTDITDTDAANLKAALLASGFLGATSAGVTTLEMSGENMVSTTADTHYLVGDVWIHVSGTSLSLTTDVADAALDEVRLANPTRTY